MLRFKWRSGLGHVATVGGERSGFQAVRLLADIGPFPSGAAPGQAVGVVDG